MSKRVKNISGQRKKGSTGSGRDYGTPWWDTMMFGKGSSIEVKTGFFGSIVRRIKRAYAWMRKVKTEEAKPVTRDFFKAKPITDKQRTFVSPQMDKMQASIVRARLS